MIVCMNVALRTLAIAGMLVPLTMTVPSPSIARTPAPSVERSERHDFDFLVGHWKLRNRRLRNPLSGSHDWYEFAGVSQAHTIWGGRGLLELVRFDIPKHAIDGLSLHFYDSKTRQWSQYWATASNGLSSIPNIGSFDAAGVGVLFDREMYRGRPIVTRYRWTHGPNTAHWEQAFSADDGKTWEINWITDYTRA